MTDLDKQLYNVGWSVWHSILLGSFENGEVSEEDIMNGTALKDLGKFVSKAAKQKDEKAYRIIIDYTDSLLKDARRFYTERHYEKASLFYAMYFEHEVNRLISIKLATKKIDENAKRKIMRQPLYDKLTWIVDLMEVKRPNDKFLKFIKPLSDDRNAFVHYKWTEHIDRDEYFIEQKFLDINNNVRYFKAYMTWQIYRGKKKAMVNQIDKLLGKSIRIK
jgi:hypothetical protein